MAESWLPTLDNEDFTAASGYDWNNVKDATMEDETVEVEIRQESTPEKNSSNSGEDCQNVVKGRALENEEAPRGTQGNMHALHGEDNGVFGIPRELAADVLADPTESVQTPINDRPAVVSNININKNNNSHHPTGLSKSQGPTPIAALGKRPRNVRSPPSAGSTQGPPIRTFFQNINEDNNSIDLNAPAGTNNGDPNSSGNQLETPVQQRDGERHPQGDSSDSPIPESSDRMMASEIEATKEIRKKVGISLDGFESVIRDTIVGDGVQTGCQ
ncbi:hypothetical protein Hanom_Chr04g00317031 [Helianthus anomalus]